MELGVLLISYIESFVNSLDHLAEVLLVLFDLSLVLSVDQVLSGESHESSAECRIVFLFILCTQPSNATEDCSQDNFSESDVELDVTLTFIELLDIDCYLDFLEVSVGFREDRDNQVEEDHSHHDGDQNEESGVKAVRFDVRVLEVVPGAEVTKY